MSKRKSGMVVSAYKHSTVKAETGEALWLIQGTPRLTYLANSRPLRDSVSKHKVCWYC